MDSYAQVEFLRALLIASSDSYYAGGSAEEVEDYRVDLPEVIELELVVTPDVSGGDAHASLAEMRVA